MVVLGFLAVFLIGGFNEHLIQAQVDPPRIEWHSEFLKQGVPEYNVNE